MQVCTVLYNMHQIAAADIQMGEKTADIVMCE